MPAASLAARYYERFVGPASPRALAAIRIVACALLLREILGFDFPASASLPPELLTRMGVMELLRALPGFDRIYGDPTALALLRSGTAACLVLGILGLLTRAAIPVAFLGALVAGGIERQWTYFFHSGIIPLYLLGVLAWTPCADAWSLDALLRPLLRRRVAGTSPEDAATRAVVYGWARYACWVVFAVAYLAAGLSKLRHGGMWWAPLNVKAHLLTPALLHLREDPALAFHATFPDWVWGALGFAALALELLFVMVLFSARARLVMPLAAVGMHAGIHWIQGPLFLDFMVLQLIYFVDFIAPPPGTATVSDAPGFAATRRAALGTAGLAALFLGWWVGGKEAYPLTCWKLFAGRATPGVVRYERMVAERASGERFALFLREALPVTKNGSRRYLRQGFRSGKWEPVRILLDMAARELNRGAPPGRRVVRFVVELREWNYFADPRDPERGKVVARFEHPVR